MQLKDGDAGPLAQYFGILEKLRLLPALFDIQSIAIHNSSLRSRYLITRFEEADRMRLADVQGFVREYSAKQDAGRLVVAADFWVPRVVTRTRNEVGEDGVESGFRDVRLVFRSPLAEWNPVPERQDLNLVWQLENALEYSHQQPEVKWQQNMRHAMQEVEAFIGTGHVSQVWGAGPDFVGSSQDAFLLYMNDKQALLRELVGRTGSELEIQLDNALQQQRHLVEVKAIGSGVLVSTRDFFSETLANLRVALANTLSTGGGAGGIPCSPTSG